MKMIKLLCSGAELSEDDWQNVKLTGALVSACLLGIQSNWQGKRGRVCPGLIWASKYLNLQPICPEILGGASVPRRPAEIQPNGKVTNPEGEDVTEIYQRGGEKSLILATAGKFKYAFFRERSPACGVQEVYDGTFSGKVIVGEGITTRLFRQKGIKVISVHPPQFP